MVTCVVCDAYTATPSVMIPLPLTLHTSHPQCSTNHPLHLHTQSALIIPCISQHPSHTATTGPLSLIIRPKVHKQRYLSLSGPWALVRILGRETIYRRSDLIPMTDDNTAQWALWWGAGKNELSTNMHQVYLRISSIDGASFSASDPH